MEKDVNATDGAADQENLDPSPESLDEIMAADEPEVVVDEPEKERLIPKARLDEVIAQRKEAEDRAESAERARLAAEARVAAIQEKQKPKMTREALRNAVEQGLISQVQAEDAWDQELVSRAKNEAKQEARIESTTATKLAKVDAEIGRFRAVLPAVADRHSDERKVLEAAYADVVDRLGAPTTPAQKLSYELTALRETFGGIDNLEKTRQAPLKPSRFVNREVGGGAAKPDATDPLSSLNNTQKRYYNKMIERRVYKDWADVRKELTWKRGDK